MTSLIPVIEFEPASYSKSTRQSPAVSRHADPGTWQTYWRESLGDSGIYELAPFRAGGWLVPITQLTRPSTLRAMLDVTLDEVDTAVEEELPMLPGGFILEKGDAAIEPTCCSDFATLEEWRAAADWRSSGPRMIWIGHPWTHVSAHGDILSFLTPSEDDPPKILNTVLSVERSDLAAAIPVAMHEVNALGNRLLPIVAESGYGVAAATIVRILTWGHHSRNLEDAV